MQRKFLFSDQLGFTLIEKLIFLSTLLAISFISYTYFDPITRYEEMNDTNRKSDLKKISDALIEFYNDHGRYPDSSNFYITRLDNSEVTEIERSWVPYMEFVPHEQNSQKRYVYWVSDTGQSYLLYASLDRGGYDKEACFNDSNKLGTPCSSLKIYNIPEDACGKEGKHICNYGVSSPNITP